MDKNFQGFLGLLFFGLVIFIVQYWYISLPVVVVIITCLFWRWELEDFLFRREFGGYRISHHLCRDTISICGKNYNILQRWDEGRRGKVLYIGNKGEGWVEKKVYDWGLVEDVCFSIYDYGNS